MSLLSSQNKEHKFYQKMQTQYNKKSFSNNNYIEQPHALNIINDNTQKLQELIKGNMELFLKNLKSIIANAKNSRIDYYFILNFMKNTDFFSEMSLMINEDIIYKFMKIQKQNKDLKQQIKKSHQKIRQLERHQSPKGQQKNQSLYHKFNGIKTISQNLYAKAKVLSQAQFSELCNRVILNEKIVIKKIADSSNYSKIQNIKISKNQEKNILKKIDDYLEHISSDNISQAEKQFNFLLGQFKKMYQTGDMQLPTMRRPWMFQLYDQNPSVSVSKAQSLRKSNQSRKQHHIYKNDKSQQYFDRYYRRSSFDKQKIINVEKTKLEQMQKLEDMYRVSLKNRKKNSSNLSYR